MVKADSPYAAGIASEESKNVVHQNPPWIWVDNTSRDEVVGAFFGLGVTFDLVDDPDVRSTISDLATRLIGFVAGHQWTPNDDGNSFQLRPEELQTLVQVARHVNPANGISGPFLTLPINAAVLFDTLSNSSYFKFSLDYLSFYNLVRLQDNGDNRGAYQVIRKYTASHQNAFFDIIDRALNGPDAARDAEARTLLDQWLVRSRRDESVDVSKVVKVCGSEACQPVPVPLRPPTDFLWQRDPFQLSGGGSGRVENPGIDYILPYWMGRYYGVISGGAVQSAAAPSVAVATNSLASLYGTNLASTIAHAETQPLPMLLGGVSVTVTDVAGTQRPAALLYVSSTQINFLAPDGIVAGPVEVTVTNGSSSQTISATVASVVPRLFSLDGSGSGLAAASAVETQVNDPGLQTPVPVYECGNSGCVPVPIELSADTTVFLTVYGTGIRNRSSILNVTATVGGVAAPVTYAGATPNFSGLDQVNVSLPLSLKGRGKVNVVVTVDGQVSNGVMIEIQ